ncbi:bromodomain-containing protein 7-like isoform X2 [Macrosteles quadrilineatus]|uniref:bromodomain-containing protein 7-like isoform X2 n=1 Tax=Macrosteles quadrilineatus TaxID=74068 RepID=UPI0023E11523|nr:bromodomain-containing protein 7-like isoform X2 [Macrosteles quadrilineatus]
MADGDDFGSKRHKKHKKEKEEKPGLRLILKVGSSSTPEHSNDSHGPGAGGDEESMQSVGSYPPGQYDDRQHKKNKKKKKKKEKDKDKERDKHDKKRKHHHKEKRKRLRDESSQDDISMGEESLQETPRSKRAAVDKTPDVGDSPMIGSPGSREPRLCVQLLRQRQEMMSAKSPLQKLLDNLQQSLEKKDPQQFFAWPVTDQIAPGYSQIIHQPMDFSTMHQKIEDNNYATLKDYVDDFKQMCGNAMIYNHPETIYYKAAKRLLHAGLKFVCEEKIRSMAVTMPWMLQIPKEALGFDLGPAGGHSPPTEREAGEEENVPPPAHPPRRGPNFVPESKFEAIPDDLTPDEVLEQTRKAAQKVRQRLDLKKVNTKRDGTTSLAILVPTEGLDPESNERPVCLGQLLGKIQHGSGTLQGFREDRRNMSKSVKPLYYGAFGSYAPSYDSTFANLSKEESDLVFQTYGDDTAVQYAESILNFAKDCDYTLTMVDNLLDLLTGGDHRKTKKVLEERKKFREEEERVRQLMTPATATPAAGDVKVDVSQLRTLADLGIDTSFLDQLEKAGKEDNAMQERLDQTSALLEKLQQAQNDRLSAPPPTHLGNIMQPTETELNLAEKITESLTALAKQVPPGAVVSIPAIRKAMGIAPDTASVGTATDPPPVTRGSAAPRCHSPSPPPPSLPATVEKSASEESSGAEEEGVGVDLESELREFLESDTALSNFPLHDDKTIEEMLSES